MNPVIVVLCVVIILLIVLTLVLRKNNSALRKENSVLIKKSYLYRLLVKKPQLKNFVPTIDKFELVVFDFEVRAVIQRYFELLLRRIHYERITYFLDEISKSKHYDILKKCLILATENDEGIFGIALSAGFDNKEERCKIEQFLSELAADERKFQYTVAISLLQEKLDGVWCDFPLEHRKAVKEVILDFENKIKDI